MKRAHSAALALLLPSVAAAQVRPGEPHNFLRTHVALSEDELRAMDDGKAVTKALETGEPREIAISGVVHIRASTSFFLRMFRDIERFDTAAIVSKKLHDPPTPGDFASMPIPADELEELRKCRLDSCNMKLGEETLALLNQEVDWDAPDAAQKAAGVLRRQAHAFARAYLEGGNAALGGYRDKKQPTFIADEIEALLENSPYILAYRPELHRYLADFPDAELEGAEDFLYWSQYDYGKPVVRVSHVTIYPTEEGENASAIITGKQLWYTHFFMTGLDIYALVRDTKSEGEAFYLVSLIRMRTDGVGGLFGNVLKNTATKSVLENVQGYLESSKVAIERYYADERRR